MVDATRWRVPRHFWPQCNGPTCLSPRVRANADVKGAKAWTSGVSLHVRGWGKTEVDEMLGVFLPVQGRFQASTGYLRRCGVSLAGRFFNRTCFIRPWLGLSGWAGFC